MKLQAWLQSFNIITCSFLLILAAKTTSSKCPFEHVYHFGDGVTDIGNSIRVLPQWFDVPAKHFPYGITYPGRPTGRWADGKIDFDFTAVDIGLPNIVPYLALNSLKSYDGVMFSVARSPVLSRAFFISRGINIEPYAVSLDGQMDWFREYLKSICSTPTDCADWLGNSLVLMGDIEGNDIGYSLTQGKSIEEVTTYVPLIVNATIHASRELIKLGATRVIIPGNAPIGCYPYILTILHSNRPQDYDDLGCLKSVNNFIMNKNVVLQRAIDNLRNDFPNTLIYYGDMYQGVQKYIVNKTSFIGPGGRNEALKSCCGIGGYYNFNSKRFCGSKGVPFCSNPNQHIFWDGFHLTEQAQYEIEQDQVQGALVSLNCTNKSLLS